MPPHKPVASLQTLAHDRVLYTVCGVILEDLFFGEQGQWEQLGHPVLTPRLQTVRDVLSNALVPRLLQDLLNTILERDEAVDATVRFTALQLLLVPGVTKLAVGHFPEPFYAPVLSAIADSAAELRSLDLRGLWVRSMHKFYLCKVIRRVHTIRQLTLRYTCDDEILALVGKHCSQLERLDISGSENITDTGMRSLYEKRIQDVFKGFNDLTKTLTIVDIGGPGAQHLPVSQVSLLLRFLPNLKSLGSFERTGAAVEMLFSEDPTLRFNLVYIHDLYTPIQRLNIIAKSCPKLTGIYLDCAKGTAVQNIHLLKELRSLKLHKIRWTDVEIALRGLNHKLRTLYLSTIWGTIDVYQLSLYCPMLTRLELHGASLMSSAPDLESPCIALPELVEVLVYRTTLSGLMAKSFLVSSQRLEHVAFGECNQITDSQLISCLTDSSLTELRELWLGQANKLTMASLECLMEKCPAITSIGNLAGWGLGPGESSFIRLQLALTNTDLTLHDYGPDSDEEAVVLVLGLVEDEGAGD